MKIIWSTPRIAYNTGARPAAIATTGAKSIVGGCHFRLSSAFENFRSIAKKLAGSGKSLPRDYHAAHKFRDMPPLKFVDDLGFINSKESSLVVH